MVLSMFLLSFIIVIICCRFEWKQICAVFFIICLYVFLLEIQLSRGEGWDPINWFNSTIFCACPNPGLGFPMSYVVVSLFCVQWVKVRGDIGGIIYHHCLSFLFLIGSFSSNYELHKWFFFKFQPIRNYIVIYFF
jgi:hypothetical protein